MGLSTKHGAGRPWSNAGLAVAREGNLEAGLRVAGGAALLADLRNNGLTCLAAYGSWPDTVDQEFAENLRRQASMARLWCEVLDQETRRIVELLAERGIAKPVILKGPAMARFYTDPRQRPYSDIDLLIPAAQVRQAASALERVGYRYQHQHLRDLPFASHEVKMRKGGAQNAGVLCEFHWCLFAQRQARKVQYQHLVSGAIPVLDDTALMLAPPQQLLVMMLHWCHQALVERRLIWVRDFIQLATPDVVQASRALADRFGLGWVADQALGDVESILGQGRWNVGPPQASKWGLARALQQGRGPSIQVLSQAWEQGPARGAQLIARKLGPRRFADDQGGVDWRAYRQWLVQKLRSRRST